MPATGTRTSSSATCRLIGKTRQGDVLDRLTPRERDVLALMAEGHNNQGIARQLWLQPRTVEVYIGSIMAKLGLTDDDESHRRVQAVLTHLDHRHIAPR